MFSKLFRSRPKWQHPNPAIRLTAIESLTSSEPEQRAILEMIAVEDVDAAVRRGAVSRLLDTAKIKQIAQNDTDADVRAAAQHHLARLLTGEVSGTLSAQQRLAEVEGQRSMTVLEHLLAHGDEAIRLAALNQIEDEQRLEEIALNHPQARIRALAAERISQVERLQKIARQSRGRDKKVYQISHTKLGQMREQIRQHEQLKQHSLEICEATEALARTEFSALYPPKLRGLTLQWEKLPARPDAQIVRRFEQALTQCQATLEQHEEALAELEAQSLAQRQLDSCCHTLESQIDRLSQQESLDTSVVESVTALLEQQQRLWERIAREIEIDASNRERFDHARQLLKRYTDAAQTLLAHEAELSQAEQRAQAIATPDDADRLAAQRKSLTRLLKQVAWPAIFATPPQLHHARRAQAVLEERQRALEAWQREQLPNLPKIVQQLTDAIDEGALQRAEKQFTKLQRLFQHLPEAQTRPHQPQFIQLKARIQELRDWRGFAGVQHKEDLCQRMEALIALEIAPQEKAILIKQLQDEWKQLGPTGPDRAKALWQRFSEASERAYEPCREFNRQQSEIRQQNLAARQTICEQLQQFLQQTDWQAPEWPTVERAIKIAKEEWRRASPVERKAGRALKDQFDTLITELRAHLQEEYRRNIEQKQQLVDQAEALIDHDDLAEAIEQAKRLQQRWRAIGLTPRSANQKKWQAFRAACDAIFARRDESRHARQAAREAHKQQAEALCSEVEALSRLDDAPLAASNKQLQQAIETFSTLEGLPAALRRRFEEACNNHRQQLAGLARRSQAAQLGEALRKARICDALESSLLQGGAPDAALLAQWDSSIELPTPLAQRLETRLKLAEQGQSDPDRNHLQSRQGDSLARRRLLCIQAEILAQLESPAEAKEARIKYQLERFNQGLAGAEEPPLLEQAWALVDQWCATSTIAAEEEATALSQRFETAIDHCITAPAS